MEKSKNQSPMSQAFLLTVGGYFGTLAAARSLGSRGIPVCLADSTHDSPTAKSRFIRDFYKSPDLQNLDAYGNWLTHLGQRHPGMVLYPTSDDLSWIIATNQNDLRAFYALYQSPQQTVFSILNKQILYKIAQNHGIEVPKTFYIRSFEELNTLKHQIEYPVIVKPKTQIGMLINVKGLISHSFSELEHNIRQFIERFRYKSEMLRYDPDLAWPMLQKFMPEASGETYSLSGFVYHDPQRIVLRAAQKVLQQPLRIGVGLAFESRPVVNSLKAQVHALCKEINYHGVFEAEFIHVAKTGKYLLMDFNPRFYGQMGFDIRRGLPLAYLAYLAALGQQSEVLSVMDQAEKWDHDSIHKYQFGWMMKTLLTTQVLGAKLPMEERKKWLQWAKGPQCYDAIIDPEDEGPHKAYVKKMLYQMFRHPRSSFKHYFN